MTKSELITEVQGKAWYGGILSTPEIIQEWPSQNRKIPTKSAFRSGYRQRPFRCLLISGSYRSNADEYSTITIEGR